MPSRKRRGSGQFGMSDTRLTQVVRSSASPGYDPEQSITLPNGPFVEGPSMLTRHEALVFGVVVCSNAGVVVLTHTNTSALTAPIFIFRGSFSSCITERIVTLHDGLDIVHMEGIDAHMEVPRKGAEHLDRVYIPALVEFAPESIEHSRGNKKVHVYTPEQARIALLKSYSEKSKRVTEVSLRALELLR